jgi:hypothetical protein
MALKGDELLRDVIVISSQITEEVRICKYYEIEGGHAVA